MKVIRNTRLGIGALVVTASVCAVAGCSHHAQNDTSTPANSPSAPIATIPAPQTAAQPQRLVVYVLPSSKMHNSASQDTNGLVPVTLATTSESANPASDAIQALISGPDSPLPTGTKLIRLKVDKATKIATVDFSSEFQTNFKGGESHEAQAVNSVLQTLGQFPDVRQVQFLVEGHKIDSLGGNVELDEPLPTPQPGQQIASSTAAG